jgi:hypothetical protein
MVQSSASSSKNVSAYLLLIVIAAARPARGDRRRAVVYRPPAWIWEGQCGNRGYHREPEDLQVNMGLAQDFSLWGTQGWAARFGVVNLFDKKYEIRDGTGVGVGAPQWGPRRGFFAGLSKAF